MLFHNKMLILQVKRQSRFAIDAINKGNEVQFLYCPAAVSSIMPASKCHYSNIVNLFMIIEKDGKALERRNKVRRPASTL